MELELSAVEIRVFGCLIEKEHTTPEYYPLSLNALTNACNQKTNRNPVMSLSEGEVNAALNSLKGKHLAWHLSSTGGRVMKYEHNLTQFNFTIQETAVICVLLLRGPQTVGEIRGRTGRMCEFKDLGEVQETLNALASREDGALVKELPRQPGTKENRFMHLLGGADENDDGVAAPRQPSPRATMQAAPVSVALSAAAEDDDIEDFEEEEDLPVTLDNNERILELEDRVLTLEQKVEELERAMGK